ncbi:ribonucleoside-diphosphate reductase [Halovenus sp. HT40]|uniref:ribonucleoside-diphosphate reductase n=1 Tax=Halovenus sp. HT40 TaxID=3126691 RepID=UPI00300EC2BB
MATNDATGMQLDEGALSQEYFTNAVYRHWDPGAIEELDVDRERLLNADLTEEQFEGIRRTVARFGAGEESVTEDLLPLAQVSENINDQMFLSSQIYEEAKHTKFFDRYWREVIDPVAEGQGFERTAPTEDRYFNSQYTELFERTEDAMQRLLTDDTPKNRVVAYCHYHLTIESVLAQTGYYGIQSSFSESGSDEVTDEEFVELPGLVNGITKIRSDEGRHVGFGMAKVREHVQTGTVEESVVQNTLQKLLPLVAGTVNDLGVAINPDPLVEYATEKLTRRIEIIADAEAEIPPVDELVEIDDTAAQASD